MACLSRAADELWLAGYWTGGSSGREEEESLPHHFPFHAALSVPVPPRSPTLNTLPFLGRVQKF